jgi:prepilin-type N-terminal cleavage/methylation domain-containing protein
MKQYPHATGENGFILPLVLIVTLILGAGLMASTTRAWLGLTGAVRQSQARSAHEVAEAEQKAQASSSHKILAKESALIKRSMLIKKQQNTAFQSAIQDILHTKTLAIKPTFPKGKTMRSKGSGARQVIQDAFTITELVVSVAIIGILSSIAIPNYISQICRSESAEAEATIGSIQAIIAAFHDETGATPSTWDDLSSISAVMTNNGPASGALSSPITLPGNRYELSIDGPTDSTYEILRKDQKAVKTEISGPA